MSIDCKTLLNQTPRMCIQSTVGNCIHLFRQFFLFFYSFSASSSAAVVSSLPTRLVFSSDSDVFSFSSFSSINFFSFKQKHRYTQQQRIQNEMKLTIPIKNGKDANDLSEKNNRICMQYTALCESMTALADLAGAPPPQASRFDFCVLCFTSSMDKLLCLI